MSEFSISAGKRMIKQNGDKRVSEDAAKELMEKLGEFVGDVAEVAIENARKDDRVTVKKEDLPV